jgi:RNA polymerase sigma factor (sigma-70 family)
MTNVLALLRRAAFGAGDAELADGELLDRFIDRRDQAAISALMRRYGPMVWGVCRRILRDYHDAEDAFQATFLVLVRKATSIVQREMVGNWLHGVAHQTALKARATTAKRQAREKHVRAIPEPEASTEPELWHELQPLLDQELSQLPENYRIALIFCDLQGKTRKQAACQLKIPEGTLSSRLTTARRMLAKRLARHGVRVSAGALAAVLLQEGASAGVPALLVGSTIKAIILVAAGAGVAEAVSIKVAALAEGVLKTMFTTKLKIATSALLAVVMLGIGSAQVTYRALASEPGESPNPATTAVTGPDDEKLVQNDSILRPTDGTLVDEKGKPDERSTLPAPKAENQANETRQTPADSGPANNAKLRALLQERLEALRKSAERMKQLHKQNVASRGEVRQAEMRVHKAALELCDTTAQRVAVLEKIVTLSKEEEEQFSQLQKQGGATQDEVREATIRRLEAEIALERAKAKPTAPSK